MHQETLLVRQQGFCYEKSAGQEQGCLQIVPEMVTHQGYDSVTRPA